MDIMTATVTNANIIRTKSDYVFNTHYTCSNFINHKREGIRLIKK